MEFIVSTTRRSSILDDSDAVRMVALVASNDDGEAPRGIAAVADAAAQCYHHLLCYYLID